MHSLQDFKFENGQTPSGVNPTNRHKPQGGSTMVLTDLAVPYRLRVVSIIPLQMRKLVPMFPDLIAHL